MKTFETTKLSGSLLGPPAVLAAEAAAAGAATGGAGIAAGVASAAMAGSEHHCISPYIQHVQVAAVVWVKPNLPGQIPSMLQGNMFQSLHLRKATSVLHTSCTKRGMFC